jgi:cytochrome c biogenesis protein CcmG/thiol:disulfide interchange protein DsbE
MRRATVLLAAVAVAAFVVIGLTQALHNQPKSGAATRFDLAQAQRRLAAAPAPLNGLYAQANQLLGGGRKAFEQRLAELKGHPVVINKWASWCVPCRAEFPMLENVAARRGKTVAFVGVNGTDKRPAALKFLRERPLPYPSYEDPRESIARAIEAPANYPITVFVDRRGHTAFIHPGSFRSEADLDGDIDRYLKP